MSIPKVAVTIKLRKQDGSPFNGATVTATLSHIEIYNGLVIPKRTEGTTDAEGVAILDLFPNERGTEGSFYNFRIPSADGPWVNTIPVVIPDFDCNLWDIVALPPFNRISEIDIAAMEVYRLRATVESLEITVKELQKKVADMTGGNSGSTADFDTINAAIEALQSNMTNAQDAISALESKIESIFGEDGYLDSTIIVGLKTSITLLQESVETIQNAMAEAQESLKAIGVLHVSIGELQSETSYMRIDISALQEKIVLLETSLGDIDKALAAIIEG